MTTETLVAPPPRMQILERGVRLVRLLGPGDQGWLEEFETILRVSAKDFLKRSQMSGTVDGVLMELAQSLQHPARAVWLVLTAEYRLLGFALAECTTCFGGPVEVIALGLYLYPRRCPRAVFPALVRAILDWGASLGATNGYFLTRRAASHAWERIGAQRRGMIYDVPIRSE